MRRAGPVAGMQRELVERAIEGDHDAFTSLVDGSIDRLYAVATPHPPRRGPRPGRGPGGARLSLAGRALPARPRRVGCLALSPDRLGLLPAGPQGTAPDRGRAARDARPGAGSLPPTIALASPSATASSESSAGCPSTSARSSCCTSTSTCRSRRRPASSTSPSGPPSPGSIAASQALRDAMRDEPEARLRPARERTA